MLFVYATAGFDRLVAKFFKGDSNRVSSVPECLALGLITLDHLGRLVVLLPAALVILDHGSRTLSDHGFVLINLSAESSAYVMLIDLDLEE